MMLPDGIRSMHPRSATKRSTASNDVCDTDHKMASLSFGARLFRFLWSPYRNSLKNDRLPHFLVRSAHARRGEHNLIRPGGLWVRRTPGGREAAVRAGERRGAAPSEAPVMISSATVPPSHAEIDRDGTVTATRPARELCRRRALRGDGALSREDGGRPPCRCVARPSLALTGTAAVLGGRGSRAGHGPARLGARRRDGGPVVDGGRRPGERCRRAASSGGPLGASGALTGGRRRSRRGRRRGDRAISAPSSCYLLPAEPTLLANAFLLASCTNPGAFGSSGACASCRCVYGGHGVRPAAFPRSATQARRSFPLLIFVVVSVPGCSRVFLVARSSVRGE
jgi:hypothetical protein